MHAFIPQKEQLFQGTLEEGSASIEARKSVRFGGRFGALLHHPLKAVLARTDLLVVGHALGPGNANMSTFALVQA